MASHTQLPEPSSPSWLPMLGLGLFISGAVAWVLTPAFPSAAAAKTEIAVETAAAKASAAPSASAAPAAPTASSIPAPPDVAAAPADAQKTKSGLASKVLKKGTGTEHPLETDKVKVHYTGWNKKGEMFDSSVTRGSPAEFPLNGVIKGWTEGVQLMVVGEKRRFWIPSALAYGDSGRVAGDLTFDVELLEIKKTPKPPAVPEDVKAAPANAKATASGLKYRVLTPGKGDKMPTDTNTVSVHYSGWTTDGKMFDSSVTRGEPAEFPVTGVIKGWTEMLKLMTPGQKVRAWIPGSLAYGDTPTRPGAPAGMLVFDIELLTIK
jgi:FKBP-type peptidyl-prolyl cis-trans isomerase